MELLCEICRTQLGRFDPEDIKLPLRGDMFKPRAKGHRQPFGLKDGYDKFYCTVCGKKAMNNEHVLITKDGPYIIDESLPFKKITIGEVKNPYPNYITKESLAEQAEKEKAEPVVEPAQGNPLACQNCGREFKTERGRKIHQSSCNVEDGENIDDKI